MSEERTKLATPPCYDDLRRCPICNGINKVKVTDSLDNITLEAETECSKCNDKNFWAHGFFMSHNAELSGPKGTAVVVPV